MNRKLKNLLVLLVGVLILTVAPADARETYRQLVARMVQHMAASNAERGALEQQLLQLANQYRRSNGLNQLKDDQVNHEAAVAHAMDMMQRDYMGHVASSGHDFDSRMRALRNGAMVLPSMAENAARLSHGNVNEAEAAGQIFQQWVSSPPHRHTLLSRDYVSVATGVVVQGGKIYADQIFIGPEVVSNVGRATTQEDLGSLY